MSRTSRNDGLRRCFGLSAFGRLLLFGIMLTPALASATHPEEAAPTQAERVAVGDQAIDFSLASIDGEAFRLSDLRGEKTAIVIFFRGTW